MTKHTNIISGELSGSLKSPFLQASADKIKPLVISCQDGRGLSFMPCLHPLAVDIRGFVIPGRDGITYQLAGDVVFSTGGSRQGATWGYVSERGDRWQGKHHKSE